MAASGAESLGWSKEGWGGTMLIIVGQAQRVLGGQRVSSEWNGCYGSPKSVDLEDLSCLVNILTSQKAKKGRQLNIPGKTSPPFSEAHRDHQVSYISVSSSLH